MQLKGETFAYCSLVLSVYTLQLSYNQINKQIQMNLTIYVGLPTTLTVKSQIAVFPAWSTAVYVIT